jgi:hypothetical protein
MTYQIPTLVDLGRPEALVHGPAGENVDGIGPLGDADPTD